MHVTSSVNVFRTKALTGDSIFTSPTGEGTAILRGHPSESETCIWLPTLAVFALWRTIPSMSSNVSPHSIPAWGNTNILRRFLEKAFFFCNFLYMSLSSEVSGMQKTTDKDQFWWEGGSRQWQVVFSQILKVAYIFCCAVGPYTSNHDSSVNGPVKKKF